MAVENAPVQGWYSQTGDKINTGVAETFIPEIWTDQLLDDLEDELILGSATITNRQYEGHFRREGDVVRIPHFIDTVEDKGMVAAYENIGDADRAALEYIKLVVNKGSSFHLEIDSLHQLQTKAGIDLMANLIKQRARALAVSIDKMLAKTILAAIAGKDANGARSIPDTYSSLPDLHGKIDEITGQEFRDTHPVTDIGVYDFIVSMLETLDIKNAPATRYLFISPKLRSALLRDPKFIDASHWGANAVMPSGVIGSILSVQVRVSNTLGSHARPAAGGPRGNKGKLLRGSHQDFASVDLLMGSTEATSLIIPHAEMAAYKPEKSFVDAIKSRVIYDAKVIRPEQIVVARNVESAIATHNAEAEAERQRRKKEAEGLLGSGN
ncbi:hypothetical protein [Streptomyces ginkgonis]|uniref:hypothetical protein n=1 Tax=Streptomyces ginkgonis TaxID=1812259 RepID=UPI002176DB00|nr:hypothetical protein [Streptomyces ginkgonis]